MIENDVVNKEDTHVSIGVSFFLTTAEKRQIKRIPFTFTSARCEQFPQKLEF